MLNKIVVCYNYWGKIDLSKYIINYINNYNYITITIFRIIMSRKVVITRKVKTDEPIAHIPTIPTIPTIPPIPPIPPIPTIPAPITPIDITEPSHTTPLKLTSSILLVDTSYWVYYRFFALRNWYKKAYPDKDTYEDTSEDTFNWLEDTVFMQ